MLVAHSPMHRDTLIMDLMGDSCTSCFGCTIVSNISTKKAFWGGGGGLFVSTTLTLLGCNLKLRQQI